MPMIPSDLPPSQSPSRRLWSSLKSCHSGCGRNHKAQVVVVIVAVVVAVLFAVDLYLL